MNLARLFKSAVRVVKENPDKALIVASLVALGVVTKLAPKVVPVVVALGKPKRG
jgi:hypothetical protein